jgi:DNA-binding response OmpR family regulator
MTEPYTIVSVEDDTGLFGLIEVTLKSLPVQLYHAKTGAEALELIPQVKADIVVMDITLPDIQGWDVLKQLSSDGVDLKCVIILTGRTDPAHRVMAHFQDVTAFINKPFQPAELRAVIRKALKLAR